MKTLIILLMFLTSIAYTQEIGYPLQEDIKKRLDKTERPYCNTYSFMSEDSSVVFNTRKSDDVIWDINYTISQELATKNGLTWITKYTQIGQNLFYGGGTYYFILFNGTHFLIQVRNASIIRNKGNRKNSIREFVKTTRVPVG